MSIARWFFAVALSWPGGAWAQSHMHNHPAAGPACADTSMACAASVTATFAPDGTLWAVWAANGVVSVASSADRGARFSAPVAVTPEPVTIDSGPDSRPRIAVDASGRVTVSFATFKDKKWNGAVFVSRSVDRGAHFSVPEAVAPDSPSQRFQNMAIDADGRVFVAWLDKRNVAPAKARGEAYSGAALAFAWADGAGLAVSRIAVDNTCECCRIGLAFAAPGRPAVVFRNVYPGSERDHALTIFAGPTEPGPVHRVSEDRWAIEACPHHGPALALGPAGTAHAAWYSGGGVRTGLHYARSTDAGGHFSAPMPIGEADKQNARPTLLTVGSSVYLAWKSFDGAKTALRLMKSSDDGVSWTEARTAAETEDDSDHPELLTDGRDIYLSWTTAKEGYRLIALAGPS